jgi:hypothetical protein
VHWGDGDVGGADINDQCGGLAGSETVVELADWMDGGFRQAQTIRKPLILVNAKAGEKHTQQELHSAQGKKQESPISP